MFSSHEELLVLNQEYAAMWHAQLKPHNSGYDDDVDDDDEEEEDPQPPSVSQSTPSIDQQIPQIFNDKAGNKNIQETPDEETKLPRKPSTTELKSTWFNQDKKLPPVTSPLHMLTGITTGPRDTYDNVSISETSRDKQNNAVIGLNTKQDSDWRGDEEQISGPLSDIVTGNCDLTRDDIGVDMCVSEADNGDGLRTSCTGREHQLDQQDPLKEDNNREGNVVKDVL